MNIPLIKNNFKAWSVSQNDYTNPENFKSKKNAQ